MVDPIDPGHPIVETYRAALRKIEAIIQIRNESRGSYAYPYMQPSLISSGIRTSAW